MKVLIVNKFLHPNGGSETYIFKIGEQLQKTGHDVEYFGMEHEGRIVGNHAESYTSDMNFHGSGFEKLLYPFKIIYSGEARRKIRLVLDDFKPDVVHLNNFNFQLTPSILYEIRKWEKENGKKIPVVYTAHDYQWVCPNHMMMVPASGELCFQCQGGHFGQCIKHRCIHNSRLRSVLGAAEGMVYRTLKAYRMVDKIICPSQFMADRLASDPLLREKLVVMHNFLDAEKQAPVNKEDYVLYFGRYSEEKGMDTLLKACKELPEIPFVFAGSGPMENRLAECPNITNRGFLQGEELGQTIAKARFAVFPSKWYENCPFSVMEAQMYGTPLLASKLGGVPELISDGETGELFEQGNDLQLREKIQMLWEHRELCDRYAANCRKIVFDTVDVYCGKLTALYEGIC